MSKQTDLINIPDAITVSGSNVGIGTSSPSTKLDVGGVIQFLDDNTPEIKIIDPDDSNYALIGYSDGTMTLSSNHGNEAGGANVLKMFTGGSERMRIDGSGNVGIGTSSPSTPSGSCLSLYNATLPRLNFKNSTTGDGTLDGFELYMQGTLAGINNKENGAIAFGTNDSERMRLDSSGNLLVGKTSTGGNVAGHQFNSNGAGYITRDGASVLHVNRKTSDGEIISIRKDDVAVGSIGVQSTDQLYIATPDGSGVGLIFDGDNRKIDPTDGAGSNLDNAVDLGTGAYRFKDAYLSGGIYLGGTGSANKLDDYEDGSFNVTLATDTASTAPSFAGTGYYIKVGNMVHLHGQVTISGSSSGGINLHIPLPFVPVNMRGALTVGLNQALSMKPSGEYLGIIVELNIAKAYIVSTAFGGGHSHLGFNECGTGLFSFSGSYRTA